MDTTLLPTLLAFGGAVISALCGVAAYLYKECKASRAENFALGQKLDVAMLELGKLEGKMTMMLLCKGGTPCPFAK